MQSKLDEIYRNQSDQKEIKKQLKKIIDAACIANLLNGARVKPSDDIKNKLLNIIELVGDCLYDLDTEFLKA